MKQMLMLFSVVFLCNTLSIAQKTISEKEFGHFVDYANYRYVAKFIEEVDKGKPYYADIYEKKVKPELEKASLNNFETILTYQKLSELLVDNVPAANLAKIINDRKFKFNKFQNNDSLISSLRADKWKNINLRTVAESIITEIHEECITASNEVDTSGITENAEIDQASLQDEKQLKQSDQLQNQLKDLTRSFGFFRVISYTLFGFLAVLIFTIYLLLRKGKLREFIINQVIGSKRVEEKFLLGKSQSYELTDKDLNAIADRVLECKILNEKEDQQHTQTLNKEVNLPLKIVTKYLKGKSGKMFSRAENNSENSFFKLFDENVDIALFEFSGDEAEAIAKRIFSEDICTIVSGSYKDAKSVKTQKPGKIKRVGEQWEVIEAIEIILI